MEHDSKLDVARRNFMMSLQLDDGLPRGVGALAIQALRAESLGGRL